MDIVRFLQKLAHLPRRIVREFIKFVDLAFLSLVNRYKRAPVVLPGGPVVSLTTFGERSEKVHIAIESIARGSVLPSRLILWIDQETLFRNLPPPIQRLQMRGMEVKLCQNYGPHTKYYPYVESQQTFTTALVTADDDVFYPRYWLKELIEANREHSDVVNCFAAHVIPLSEDGFAEYRNWKLCNSSAPSFCHLAMGCTGVIYPIPFLTELKRAGTVFETCCPKGDDLWLHVQALRAGYKVRQIHTRLPYFSFQGIPGTQRIALRHDNVDGDGNERQIRATYTKSDIHLLRAECNDVPPHIS